MDYELGLPFVEGGGENDLAKVLGNLVLDGVLNISPINFGGAGDYTLLTYGGSLTDNGLAIGTIPPGFDTADFTIDVSVPTKVLLRVIPEPSTVLLAVLGCVAVSGWLGRYGHLIVFSPLSLFCAQTGRENTALSCGTNNHLVRN